MIRAELGGWTREGIVRQGAFKGVEVGKDPLDVTRERAVETKATVSAVEAELPPEAPDRGPREWRSAGRLPEPRGRGREGPHEGY